MKTERKRTFRVLSVILSLCMLISVIAPLTVFAAEGTGWTQDEATAAGGEVNEITDEGWLHLASSSSNANTTTAGSYPAVFISDNLEFDQTAGGSIEFTLKTDNSAQDRFGVYLGYVDPGHGLFIGYDGGSTGGWYWQKYDGGSNAWYGQNGETRTQAVPAVGVETPVKISWTADTFTLVVDGTTVFEDESYSISGLSNKIALKCGSFDTQITDVYVKGEGFVNGSLVPETYEVSGTVVDGDGTPVSGVTVTIGDKTVTTDAQGAYSANLAAGEYTVKAAKDGYNSASASVTVTDADVVVPEIVIKAIVPIEYGDINEDGKINASDATLALQKYAGITITGKFNADNADVNADGSIDSGDATLILQYYAGIITKFPADGTVPNPDIPDLDEAVILSTPSMDVQLDPDFPRVQKYIMKGKYAGKAIAGQIDDLSVVTINGVDITPEVTTDYNEADKSRSELTYTLNCESSENNINCTLTVKVSVKDNTLQLQITEIENKLNRDTYPILTINFPNHSLVSVQSNQGTPNLMANVISSITYITGDTYMDLTDDTQPMNTSYSYAVISNNELSASVESNSLYERPGAGIGYGGMTDGNNTRIAVTVENKGEYKSLGLSSSPWVYDTYIKNYDGSGENTLVKYADADMPYVRVAITGDENGDKKVNWNDGAIAFRSISHEIPGSDTVPEHVTYRICMNFGGQAQNPFLTTLDNVKKVALHTDGLGQSILLKGYGNEGHDSGHPDYEDIGTRLGGTEDMLTLLKEGKKYGATFGIHINASEMYPEAKAFSEELVKRNDNGGLSYGWNWLDQGIGINGTYDLVSGERQERFDALYKKVGNNLDFIYLDVWGNSTSGNEGTVTTRYVGKQITNYWRMGNEWGIGFDWFATMQHWAADLAYGDRTAKGHNSNLMRFIRNNEKDSWIIDCQAYGGAANAPLLGGMEMYDFEGWQGRTDYDEYIRTVYSHNVTTKFIQHFDITKWDNSTNSYQIEGYDWYPEMYIELKDEDGNIVTLTRGSDDVNSPAYRDRTITYNGVVIATGAVTTGATSVAARVTGTEKYLIPWFWDSEGNNFESDEQKLYHWNCVGGESTWTLVDEWSDCENVIVYKLTDTGRTEPQTVEVVDGKITINAQAETPYVVYKGAQADETVTWSEGMHLTDVGFNSGDLSVWNPQGGASIVKSQSSNPMLQLNGDASVSQVLTDLEAGERYAVYVGVDNRSTTKASITLKNEKGEVIDTNYTLQSIARNYVQADSHSNRSATIANGGSYFQNMYVFFDAPASGKVTLELKHVGDGNAYFDDIRVVKNEFDGITKDSDGNITRFENDFEDNAQGIYPFVVGGAEGVTDNRVHLSERHDPYTQAGWDVKKLDDVISDTWSVKVNGLTGRNNLVMLTIPQNFHFEPNETYTVAFDYQLGSEGTYVVTYGDGEFAGNTQTIALSKTLDTNVTSGKAVTKKCVFTITGAASGQSWFGIYSTGVAAQTGSVSGSAADFGGYKDIVIDNLVIVKSNVNRNALNEAIEEVTGLDVRDYSTETWAAMQTALAAAETANANLDATQDQIDAAAEALNDAIDALSFISCNITGKIVDTDGNGISGATVTLKADGESNRRTTTNDSGEYSFTNLPVRDYSIMVSASGFSAKYNIKPTIVQGDNSVANIVLSAKTGEYDYSNEFNDATTISGMEDLEGNNGHVTVTHSDGAAVVSFPGGNRNNVVFSEAGTFVNAKVEFDLTPSSSSQRFGVVFRANNMDERVFVGVGDENGKYFWEHFNGTGNNSWSDMFDGPVMQAGTKYHIVAELNGSTIKMSVNNSEVVNRTIAATATTADGYIGFECRNNESFTIDNVTITDLGFTA